MWICFLLGSLTLPRNKIWYFLMHKVIWQSFNSNSAKLGFTTWFKTEVTHFQMEQKNNCLCLQINFYLANMHGRGENLKANMDSRSEWQLFLPEKSVPTEFALKLWYEINMSFKKKHYCQYFQFIQSQNINSVERPASVAQLDARPTGDQEVAGPTPTGSATFFRGDWSWNIFYGHSLPSADSRRAIVSFWQNHVHNTG